VVDIGAALGGLVNTNAFGSLIYWMGYGLLGLVFVGGLGFVYYLSSFNHKVTVYRMFGSGKDGVFSVTKPVSNRVKWTKNKTAWRKLWPLFNNKDIEPFDAEFIYPGRRVIAFEINNEWVPGRINIKESEDTLRAEINPVPYFVRNWQGLQYQKNAIEYATHSFWEDNKALILGFLTVLVCMIAMLIAIYFTYQYLAPGRADLAAFTDALRNAGNLQVGPY